MQANTKYELTMQDAADFLNVSHPFVIKEIDANRLKCCKVNGQRRIEFEELRLEFESASDPDFTQLRVEARPMRNSQCCIS